MSTEKNSIIPTIDVLPPMTRKARDILYGVLAWAAAGTTAFTAIVAVAPQFDLNDELLIVNTAINALWVLGGFKAKANVPPPVVEDVEGRHEL